MILTRSTSLVTVSLFCLVAMPASSAMSATKKKSKTPARPTVTSVAPLTAGVGDLLTIKGKNFVLGKKKNTVFFKADGKPAVAVKANQSTKTTMKLFIPDTIEKQLTFTNGVAQPTRFRLRILAKRFGKGYVAAAMSPTIAPANGAAGRPAAPVTAPVATPLADCDNDGFPNNVDGDDDNDLLSDFQETGLRLDPCKADTDGDGSEDGFEYQSAIDLNNTSGQNLPSPDKRPYPNPLDGGDGASDFDGDALGMHQEHLMWKTYGPRTLMLSYSAGLRKSLTQTSYSCPVVPGPDCDDDYRDIDSDGLSNWDEFNGRMTPAWWLAKYEDEPAYTQPFQGTSAIDTDTDGDGISDGGDDVDHDLWTNAEEISRNVVVGLPRGDAISRYRVHPLNPCLPDPENSPTCPRHPPFDNPYPPYDTGWITVPIPWP